jgi:peptide/nickel transport system substrate-binding protein
MTYTVPEGAIGFNDSVSYSFDPEKAKALIEASDYDGRQISMLCTSADFARESEVVQAIQSMLNDAGLSIHVNMLDSATYQTDMAEGKYDIVIGFYLIASGNPYKLFKDLLYDGGIRGSNYHSAELDAKIEVALATLDEAAYAVACREALDVVFKEHANYIALYSPQYINAAQAGLDGVTMHPQNGWIAKYITVTG